MWLWNTLRTNIPLGGKLVVILFVLFSAGLKIKLHYLSNVSSQGCCLFKTGVLPYYQ